MTDPNMITGTATTAALLIYQEIRAAREHAYWEHGDMSLELLPITDMRRLGLLMEQVGGVAREFNEVSRRAHVQLAPPDLSALRKELIRVAAAATAWADGIAADPAGDNDD